MRELTIPVHAPPSEVVVEHRAPPDARDYPDNVAFIACDVALVADASGSPTQALLSGCKPDATADATAAPR